MTRFLPRALARLLRPRPRAVQPKPERTWSMSFGDYQRLRAAGGVVIVARARNAKGER